MLYYGMLYFDVLFFPANETPISATPQGGVQAGPHAITLPVAGGYSSKGGAVGGGCSGWGYYIIN